MIDRPVCPCESGPFVPEPDIPPGLASLPRQRARFAEFRRALLAHARMTESGALDDWPADDDRDLGLLLFEIWAYLLDVLAFYDREIAQESYLSTARRTASAAALADLIGYIPRPASAATVRIALRAAGAEAVTVPRGGAFRTEAFDDEKPQIFEVSEETPIHPARNRWTYGPVRPDFFYGEFWIAAGQPTPEVEQLVALRVEGVFSHAGRISKSETVEAADGATYTRIRLDPDYMLLLGSPPAPASSSLATPPRPSWPRVDRMVLYGFGQTVSRTPFLPSDSNGASQQPAGAGFIILDALYPQIATGDPVVVETETGALFVTTEYEVKTTNVPVRAGDTAATIPATRLEFSASVSAGGAPLRVHLQANRLSALTNPALTRLGEDQLNELQALLDRLEPFDEERPEPAALAVKGEGGRGFESGAKIEVDAASGTAEVRLDEARKADPPLKTPVRLFGNLVSATRGETVPSETLGSGDASVPFQSFTLKKGPLTHLPSPAEPNVLIPALDVRVNGVLWRRVRSFVTSEAEDEVYTVRTDAAGKGVIGFGDGARGKRPPSGDGNIVASYRHGAGAAKPPAGGVKSVASAIPGVDGVAFSLAASGGSDADEASDIRRAAPASTLSFGRPVSLADYAAIARSYPGVVNAAAGWAVEAASQRPMVRIWAISEGGSTASDLGAHLRKIGDPDVTVKVTEAVAVETELSASITVSDRRLPEEVKAAARAALADPETGLLAPRNVAIGEGIFRSAVSARLQSVPGVEAVRSLTFRGGTIRPEGLPCVQGRYRDFTKIQVEASS